MIVVSILLHNHVMITMSGSKATLVGMGVGGEWQVFNWWLKRGIYRCSKWIR